MRFFWNVVGRVGRPLSQIRTTARIETPKVVFLLNNSSTANFEDKQNSKRFNELIRKRGNYAVASPFLDFLNVIRQKSNIPIAKLVSELAEKPNLHDIVGDLASSPWRGLTLGKYLIELDNQLFDLLHEAYLDVDITLDWLQQSVKELVDLFVKASVIKATDFSYISEVVQARLQFIAKNISKEKRQQDYLLGLPYGDGKKIKQNAENLLVWYQGSIGLFNNNREIGIVNLVNLMYFVTELSICKRNVRQNSNNSLEKSGQLSLDLKVDDQVTIAKKRLLGDWINGKSSEELSKQFNVFGKYQELERNLPWGISAIARYLHAVAKEKKIALPADLEYLPSMVKYGANSKVACHLIRLNIPRKYAITIAQLYASRSSWIGNNEFEENFYLDFESAVKSLQSLTDEEIDSIGIETSILTRIQKIIERHKPGNFDEEPEFPPFEMEDYK